MFRFITVILLFLCFSCGKNQDQPQQTLEAEIVAALNIKDIDKADALIEDGLAANPEQQKLLYYKAQVSSLRADIDIYSLFPIVKMELFEFALTEWSSINEYSNRMKSNSQDILIGEDTNQTEIEIEKTIKAIEEMDDSAIEFKYKLVYKNYSEYDSSYDSEGKPVVMGSCYVVAEVTSNIFPPREIFYDNTFLEAEGLTCDQVIASSKNKFENKEFLRREAISLYGKYLGRKKRRKESAKIVKALMSIYSSINVIKNVPKLDQSKFVNIKEALVLLAKSRKQGGDIGENAFKHQAMLAGYLLLGSLQNSIELNDVKDPTDIICKTKSKLVVDQYEYFLTGIRYLHDAMIGSEFSKKNPKQFEKAKEYLDMADEKLSEEQIDGIIDDIEDYQEDNC